MVAVPHQCMDESSYEVAGVMRGSCGPPIGTGGGRAGCGGSSLLPLLVLSGLYPVGKIDQHLRHHLQLLGHHILATS